MIVRTAEIEIDDESIIYQIDQVIKEYYKFDEELSELRDRLMKATIKEKRDSEESQGD